MVPIEDRDLSNRLYQILSSQLADNTHRYELQYDRNYKRVVPKKGEEEVNSQELFEKYVSKLSKLTKKSSPKHISKLAKKMLKDS